jgi:predicted ester cyclase
MPCEASYYGINGISSWLGEDWKTFPNLTVTDYFMVANGDIVSVYWTAKGTSQGNYMIFPPTNDVIEYTGVSMYRLEGDKIAEIWETRNTFAILKKVNPEMGDDHHSH